MTVLAGSGDPAPTDYTEKGLAGQDIGGDIGNVVAGADPALLGTNSSADGNGAEVKFHLPSRMTFSKDGSYVFILEPSMGVRMLYFKKNGTCHDCPNGPNGLPMVGSVDTDSCRFQCPAGHQQMTDGSCGPCPAGTSS